MDIVCFSHLRWDFVYQRPQHLLSRFAYTCRVFYVEEPIYNFHENKFMIRQSNENVWIVIPHVMFGAEAPDAAKRLKEIIESLFTLCTIKNYLFWYYTPMAFLFTKQFKPKLVVYDCMDELSAFKFAPPALREAEQKLLQKADVVFTGGQSLYNAKKHLHKNIHAFPSSIDKKHFLKARKNLAEPGDQKLIPHPRLGFFGVLDERFDIDLIKKVADAKPEWQFVFIGPIVKINRDELPQNSNIHYLWIKSYNELPDYISGWDIALIPFAINESTKFISPTKTPEYLAAGKPVISSAIEDVVHPYGDKKLVHIIKTAEDFVAAAAKELRSTSKEKWLKKTDVFLENISWDATWRDMFTIIQTTLKRKQNNIKKSEETYV